MEMLDIFIRFAVAFICGCAVGSERQIHHRTAGLRTNVLVAIGACAFTVFDLMNHINLGSDLRVSAQIVSGIGFIGGGAILKDGFNIKGITTAATLWCAAGAGMLAGGEYLWEAGMLSLIVMMINIFLRPIVSFLDKVDTEYEEYIVKATCDNGEENDIKQLILKNLEAKRLSLKDLQISNTKKGAQLEAVILSKRSKVIEELSHKIAKNTDINSISWEVIK